MDINEYISSGILELYVAGALATGENREVEVMARRHREVRDEIEAIEAALIALTSAPGITPRSDVRVAVLDRVGQLENAAEQDGIIGSPGNHPTANGLSNEPGAIGERAGTQRPINGGAYNQEDAASAIRNRMEASMSGVMNHSTDEATVSTEKGTVSTEKGTVSTEKGTVSTEKGTVSTEKGTVSTEKGTVSTEKGTVSTEKGTVSTEEAVGGTEEAVGGTEERASASEGGAGATEEVMGSAEETKSLAEKGMDSTEKATSSTAKATDLAQSSTRPTSKTTGATGGATHSTNEKRVNENPQRGDQDQTHTRSGAAIFAMQPRARYLIAASIAVALMSSAAAAYFAYQWNVAERELSFFSNENLRIVREQSTLETKLGRSQADLAILMQSENRIVRMKGLAIAPKTIATVYWNPKTRDLHFDRGSLPPLPRGKQYQLWAIVDGKPVDAGTIRRDGDGEGLQQMKSIATADAFAVTLEPEGGSVAPTLDAMYVIGTLAGESG